MEVIESCFTTEEGFKPGVSVIDHCADYKRWLSGKGDYEDPEVVPVEDQDDVLLAQQQAQAFQATPLFSDIHNTSFHHQFKIFRHTSTGKVVVQARANAEPRKHWEPEEGVEVLHRLPDEECPFIIQPKAFKDEDWKALQAVSTTFKKCGHLGYSQSEEVQQFWQTQEEYQKKLRAADGLLPACSAPQGFFKKLRAHDSHGKCL